MLEYERTDVINGIDINKTSYSNECKIYYQQYFFEISFTYQPLVCNGFYDLLQKSISFNYFAIITVGRNNYRIHFWSMTEPQAASKMKYAALVKKWTIVSESNLISFIFYNNVK